MTDARPHLIPGSDHPITLERYLPRVVVQSGSLVIANGRALEMHEAAYPAGVLHIAPGCRPAATYAAANTTPGAPTRARPPTTTS